MKWGGKNKKTKALLESQTYFPQKKKKSCNYNDQAIPLAKSYTFDEKVIFFK